MREKLNSVKKLKPGVSFGLISALVTSFTLFKIYKSNEAQKKEKKGWLDYFNKSRNHTWFEPVFEETAKKIEDNFADSTKLRAWDLGTGTGKIALMLGKRPDQRWDITATDKYEEALEIAEARVAQEGITSITLNKQDVTQGSAMPHTYHLITASRVLPFVEPKENSKVINKIVSHLEPGGCFVGHFFGPNHTWCKDKNKNLTCLTPEQIKPLFAQCDKAYHAEETQKEAPATSGQSVNWHEVLVTACKNKP